MKLDELYRQKGEAVTQLELWQSKLQNANKLIVEELNKLEKEKNELKSNKESGTN